MFPKLLWISHRENRAFSCSGILTMQEQIPVPKPGEIWFGATSFDDKKIENDPWHHMPSSFFFQPRQIVQENPLFAEEYISSWTHKTLLPEENIWEKNMQHLLDHLEKGSVDKVVQARRLSCKMQSFINAKSIASRVFAKQKRGVSFFLQMDEKKAFISATPELLYERNDRILYSYAIAGTIPSDNEDKLLLESEKDQKEQQFVTKTIEEKLQKIATNVQVHKQEVIKAQHVKHLCTPISGTLLDHIDDKTIITLLHPTPAVLGLPEIAAWEWIQKHEMFQRGYYAAPLCRITEQKAEIAVGIRSCLVIDDMCHLFAGSGIVKGSSIEKERAELETKWGLYL